MEKTKTKTNDHKVASATSHEPDSNDLLSMDEQNQFNVAVGMKSAGASSPSRDNAPCHNQQHPSVFQWPYTPQNNVERPSSSIPCDTSQSPPSTAVSQWQQLPHAQLNFANHQGHPLPHPAQSLVPFWLPQFPGYHLPGVNAPAVSQPSTPIGTINSSWPASGLIGGDASSKEHPQVPNLCYQVNYTYPGFPAQWDPSSWWNQVQLSQPPSNYALPGFHGYFSLQPSKVPCCSSTVGQSSQRGIIRPLEKVSKKHQQLWEAQSAENVQLWAVIGQLQSDIADKKTRIMKLEAEVSSLKQAMELPTVPVTGTAVSGQPSKRGRPRKTVASVDPLASYDALEPHNRGRKPSANIFQKVILTKAENTVKPSDQTAIIQQEKKVSNAIAKNNSDTGINGSNTMMPAFHGQVHQEISQKQRGDVDIGLSLEMKTNNDKNGDTNDAFAVLTQQLKGMHHKPDVGSLIAATNNGVNGWPDTTISEGSRRNVLSTSLHGMYNDGSVIRQGGQVSPGWSCGNEEDASEELDDVGTASAKDENEEEMGDEGSSASEEIVCSKGENLPQSSNW